MDFAICSFQSIFIIKLNNENALLQCISVIEILLPATKITCLFYLKSHNMLIVVILNIGLDDPLYMYVFITIHR